MMYSAIRRFIFDAGRHFVADRRGAVIILFALALIPLLAMIGLAVDSARAYLVNARLGQAIDAAALAGGRAFRNDYRDEDVERYFAANFPSDFMDVDLEPLSVDFDDDNKQVTVVARAAVPTTFMRVLSIDKVDVSARAVVSALSRGLELALVLDVTGSMEGSKLESLKTAVGSLLGILYGDRETVDNLWVAVVPFSSRVNFSPHDDWLEPYGFFWDGCGEPRSGPQASNDDPPSVELWEENDSASCPDTPMLPLTAENSTIDGVIEDLEAEGNTRTDIGMVWGWRAISPQWRGLWGNPELPLDYNTENMDKAVIIMTDGENRPYSIQDEADDNLADECADMKDEGIIIYTITFQAPSSLDSLYQSCASSSDKYYKSPTDEALDEAFKAIGAQLSKLRIAQ